MKHFLTAEGKKQLEEKLNYYKSTKRVEVSKKIANQRVKEIMKSVLHLKMLLIPSITGLWDCIGMHSVASPQCSHWRWKGPALSKKVSCPPVGMEEGKVDFRE